MCMFIIRLVFLVRINYGNETKLNLGWFWIIYHLDLVTNYQEKKR